jgi:hypothetical protein
MRPEEALQHRFSPQLVEQCETNLKERIKKMKGEMRKDQRERIDGIKPKSVILP